MSATDAGISVFVPIEKVDPDQRMVWGYASTPDLDSQGERVATKAIEAALPDYMKFGNIREMHQPSAVGKTKTASVDEKGLHIGVKVVDDAAWAKVKEGVYNGFSIGGTITEKVDEEIRGLRLVEISLVDRPANPNATFDVWKLDEVTPPVEAATQEAPTQEVVKQEAPALKRGLFALRNADGRAVITTKAEATNG